MRGIDTYRCEGISGMQNRETDIQGSLFGAALTPMKGESIIFLAKEWGQEYTSCDAIFEEIAKRNKVLWVNSIATRTPNLASVQDWRRIFNKLRRCLGGLSQVGPQAWLYQPLFIPLPHSALARKINLLLLRWSLRGQIRRIGMRQPQLWMFQPNGAFLIGHLDESVVVYYCTDEWSEFPHLDRAKVAVLEHELLEKADVCFAASEPLAESKKRYNPNTFLAVHGVDYERFVRALDPATAIPDDIAAIPRPLIGFFGVIRDHLDKDLLTKIADSHPEWSLVLIGSIRMNVDELRARPNIHFLGLRPIDALPGYCKYFSVGIIPYRQNDFIRNVNPIKLRQYLSAGLPVVSTFMVEVQRLSHLVTIAHNHEDFIAGIEEAVETDTPLKRSQRSDAMRQEGWGEKVAHVCDRVMQTKAAKNQNMADRHIKT